MAQSVKQFRIFLSSPGDAYEERKIARDFIDDALSKDPFIRGRATFDPISWDDPEASAGLPAHLTPQEAINQGLPKSSDCDVVLVILWSRMGTPLPAEFTKEDGSTYQSGTEWEFEDALNAAERDDKPTILLYRRTEEPKFGGRDPLLQDKLEQLQRVDTFFDQLKGPDDSLRRTVTNYACPDEFQKKIRQDLQAVVSRFLGQGFSEELGVTQAAVQTMLKILEEQQVPADQLEAKLKEIAERQIELTEKLHNLSRSNDEPEITKRREQAAEAIELGDYDRADSLLAEAAAIDRRAIDEQQEELDCRRLSAAATIGQQGELERARLNYRSAAEHFAEAASLVPTSDDIVRFGYLMKQASALDDQGRDAGDIPALVKAIDIYRLILKEHTRERMPLDWAMIQNTLGGTLLTLGEYESGTTGLRAAADAFEAALEEYNREREPLDWAAIQNNLGNALGTLGERESGTANLEAAVDAYRAALEEYNREHVPLKWATIQNNLGATLQTLGERESGTASLEAAVDALKTALEERTRERAPLQWATTQNNLGATLQTLGERESGTASLEAAVDAFRAALEERTRERVPLQWATTQNNLGATLQTLGERESGAASLEAAVDAFHAVLEERTRERVPLQWANTQNKLGNALRALGEGESGTASLEAAVDAFRAALEENTRERVLLQWAKTQNNLGNALSALGERESGTANLEAAVDAYRAALEEHKREHLPLDWAAIQNNLGATLRMLGVREGGTASLEASVDAYRAALEVRTRERTPLDWAVTKNNLGTALRDLGERTGCLGHLETALETIMNASEVYLKDAKQLRLQPYFEKRISEIKAAIALIR